MNLNVPNGQEKPATPNHLNIYLVRAIVIALLLVAVLGFIGVFGI